MRDKKLNMNKNFPIGIFIIIIIIVINGCFFVVDYNKNNDLRENIITQTKEEIWNAIEQSVIKEYSYLTSDAKYLSKKIEAALLREYGANLDDLREDFDNGTFDQTLYDLFKDEILKDSSSPNQSITEPFNYVLGFKENLLAVFSDSNREGLTTNMSWDEYFNASVNIPLTEKLIHNILNKNISDVILLYQTGGSFNTSVEHNISTLKDVYTTYGLEGLKDFEFVNVSYITEYGDIFGTNDYLYLQSVSNHKMILVKTSNVYDTICPDILNEIKNIEANQEILLIQISDSIARKSLEFITVTLCLIMLIVVSSVFYNKSLINK